MIFLIEYDRHKGLIITSKCFENSQRRDAENTRIEIELELNRKGVDHEVVLLEASSWDALRQTHRRYFEDLSNLLQLPNH